jgi:vancomycin permeability regulator SanA
MASRRRTVLRAVVALALLPGVVVWVASAWVDLRHRGRIHSLKDVPPAPVAIIFGAGLSAGGEPSPILRQRVEAGMALYRAGKVRKLLVTGDNTDRFHDETKAMRRYAIDRGLPPGDVVGDYAGVSTWDSCFRAREIFGVERAVLVSQAFHLPRALYMANSLGIEADGVAADGAGPRVGGYWVREFLARAQAVWTAVQRPPARILGEREPIDFGDVRAPPVTVAD